MILGSFPHLLFLYLHFVIQGAVQLPFISNEKKNSIKKIKIKQINRAHCHIEHKSWIFLTNTVPLLGKSNFHQTCRMV